jgi:hypothetical protein
MAENKKPRDPSSNRIILIAVLAIIILAAGIYLYAGWVGYQEAPKLIEVRDSRPLASEPYTLSPEQETNLNSYGYPEAFTILFYEEETPDQGVQPVRLETWDYYTLGIGLTFINGELIAEDPLEVDDPGLLAPLPYTPEQFSAFMSLDDVIAAAGIESYIEVPLDKELMDEGILYYADSLSFGLQDNQLVYIEALALTEE